MRVELLSYSKIGGWSAPFPALDSENTLVLVFGSASCFHEELPLLELASAFPNAHIVGCSTAGEVFSGSILDDSLSVAIVRFESTRLKTVMKHLDQGNQTFGIARSAALELHADDLKTVFLFSDGLFVNGSDLSRGMNDVFRGQIPISGGLAGDNMRFAETFVVHQGILLSQAIVAVGLYGDSISVGHGSKGGWNKFGHEREVTRSKGNVLYELDGKPALETYKDYLGDRVEGLPGSALHFPLAIKASPDDPKSLIRSVLAVSEDDQSMTFAGDIPEGYIAQFMYANYDRVIAGAADAATDAAGDAAVSLAIIVSCVGRRLVLADRSEEELEAVQDALPKQTKMIGFYSYGELTPGEEGYCDLHNQSMTITTLAEAA